MNKQTWSLLALTHSLTPLLLFLVPPIHSSGRRKGSENIFGHTTLLNTHQCHANEFFKKCKISQLMPIALDSPFTARCVLDVLKCALHLPKYGIYVFAEAAASDLAWIPPTCNTAQMQLSTPSSCFLFLAPSSSPSKSLQ